MSLFMPKDKAEGLWQDVQKIWKYMASMRRALHHAMSLMES
jgi:hypothetical protein